MNRFALIFAAGCLLLGISGCRKTAYERTVAHVDVGGKVLVYQENAPIREPFRKWHGAVRSLLLKKSQGMPQFIIAAVSEGVSVLFDAVNPDVLQASAYSVSGGDDGKPYRLRSFACLGENPAPSVFDLIPAENRSFALFSELPEETVFAIGGYASFAPFWKNLRNAAERGKNAQIRLFLDMAESQVQQTFGIPMDDFLRGFEAEQQFFAAWDGRNLQIKAVVCDGKGVLKKAFAAYAAREEIRKVGKDTYLLAIDGVEKLGWKPQLKFDGGKAVFVSSPELFKIPSKPLGKSAAWAKYLQGLPAKGTGYIALHVPEDMLHGFAKAFPDAAPFLKMIPEITAAGVTVRESDGISGTGRSSLLLAPCGNSLLPLAGAAAGMLNTLPSAPSAQQQPVRKKAAPAEKEKSETAAAAASPASSKPKKTVSKKNETFSKPKGVPGGSAVSRNESGETVSCRANMMRIMTGLLLYAGKNDDAFPRESGAGGLYELVEKGFTEARGVFRCASDRHPVAAERRHESSVSYYYIGGLTLDDAKKAPNAPILIEKPGIHEGTLVHVLFVDGHWEAVDLHDPYVSLAQALDGCQKLHPTSPEMAKRLQSQIPRP